MSISETYEFLRETVLSEYADLVVRGDLLRLPSGEVLKLRLYLADESFVEVNVSATGRYSYHWERRLTGRSDIYRFDNAPHSRWQAVATYPNHFHNGAEDQVESSEISSEPMEAIRQVCAFIRAKLRDERALGSTPSG
jgi:hypothetical protein